MADYRNERQRKLELLERYRSLRLEEMLVELRPQAAAAAEEDRLPWRGEFRPREEVLELYKRRRKLDRRFLTDMSIVVLVLLFIVVNGRRIVQTFVPRPAFQKGTGAEQLETQPKGAQAEADRKARREAKRARREAQAEGQEAPAATEPPPEDEF